MSCALIFPPGVDPRGPHLALPSLAAGLRRAGETVHLIDANIEAVRRLLQPQRVRRAGAILAARDGSDPATTSGRLALSADTLAGHLEPALAVFDDPVAFFDAAALGAARETLVAALDLLSLAHHADLRFNIHPARYDLAACDPRCLDDLVAATGREELNLFAGDWKASLLPRLRELRPELVGISITNRQQMLPGLMLARALRDEGWFTLIGGTVFTKFEAELRERPGFFDCFADAVMLYEGETALLMLLGQLRTAAPDLSQVPNLVFRAGAEVTATRVWVEDINRLPAPDFDGLDLSAYLAPFPVLPILTGKGCYYNRCRFCDIPYINHVSRKAYRVRRAELIAADIRSLHAKYRCRHFVITDEALSPRLLLKLADELAGFDAGELNFTGYARLEPGFTAEVCERLARMGLRKLYFGLESADQATLDHMDKGARVADAAGVLANCDRAGIRFHVFSIVGFPQESEASARTTLAFFTDHRELIDHPGNSFDIHPFGLELRTDYFRDRDQLGVEIDPAALAGDFVIGLEPGQWVNRDGLSGEQVERLLNDEFHPALRACFDRYHATPESLWPGFEEYAVLYCEQFADRPFPHLSRLPSPAESAGWRLNWNPTVARLRHGERVLLVQRAGYRLVSSDEFAALDGLDAARIDAALARRLLGPAGTPEALRGYLNRLIGQAFVQLAARVEVSETRESRTNSELAHRN